MTPLSVSLLGPFQASFGPRPLTQFRSSKVKALLIYLVVENGIAPGTAHPRETLMELLWPGLPLKSAQSNLRQTLYHLRKMIPAQGSVSFLMSSRKMVQINPDYLVDLDVVTFTRLAQEGNGRLPPLEQAGALIRGDFLADFYLPDSAVFEAWAAGKRAEFHYQALDVLDKLTRHYIQAQRYTLAQQYARQQLTLDDLCEHACQQLMTALAQSGQRSAALAQYEQFCQRLTQELHVAPSQETQSLYQQLLKDKVRQAGEMPVDERIIAAATGRFIREKLIATGGHGALYRGHATRTGETVVIKQIRPDIVIRHPNILKRFVREGEALRQLNHPNIVKIIAAQEQDGEYIIVMEYVPGGNLRELMESEGRLPVARVLEIALELADALTRAHHLGIIHRDLKPSNVLLAENGAPRLTDFGIAYMSKRETRLTQDGAFMGSPPYMSPEVCKGEELDTRSDIWSFGVLLYEMLAGRLPFDGENVTAVLIAILNDPTPDLTQFREDAPAPLVNLIERMLVKEREERLGTMRQAAAELEAIRDGTWRDTQTKALASTGAETETLPDTAVHWPAFLRESEAEDGGARPLFVAREEELAYLETSLQKAINDRGQLVFVIGGPGRGKSSLLQTFAAQAQQTHPNLLVASGLCNAFSGIGDSYLPFRQILALLTGDVEAEWRAGRISHEQAHRLWRILPETAQALLTAGPDLIGTLVKSEPLVSRAETAAPQGSEWLARLQKMVDIRAATLTAPDIGQTNLFSQYTHVLQHVARQAPLLILLDDLQWADTASISLLFHLGRAVSDGRILVIGAYRPEEVALEREGQRHPLARVVNELQRLHGNLLVDLGQENKAGGRIFVDAFLDSEPNQLDENFRQTLTDRTGGHALFVVELTRAMQERGDLFQDEAGQWRVVDNLDWEALPARVEAVIVERISRLAEALRQILSVASVEGEEFTAQVVAQIQNIPERHLLRRLAQELDKRHRLVREQGEVQVNGKLLSHYRFAHHLFQRYLYNELSRGERRLLHGEIATVLENLFAESVNDIAVQLAYHYRQAGIAGKARRYLAQAGRQAQERHAYAEAASYFSQALALTADGRPERFDLLAARAAIYATLAWREDQWADVTAMLHLAELLGEDTRRCDALLARADFHGATHPWLSRESAAQAATIAQEIGDVTREGQALRHLGENSWVTGNAARSREELEAAVTCFHQAGMRAELAATLHRLALFLVDVGEPAAALARGAEALQLSREIGDRRLEAISLRRLAIIHSNQGQPAKALPFVEQALALHRETGDQLEACRALHVLGVIHTNLGHSEKGAACLRQFLQVARSAGSSLDTAHAIASLLLHHYLQNGEYEAGWDFLEDQLQNTGPADADWSAWAQYFKVYVLLLFGRYQEALDLAQATLPVAEELGDRRLRSALLSYVGWSLAELNHFQEARRILQSELEQSAELAPSVASFVPTSLALLALPEGRPANFEAGLEMARRAIQMSRGVDTACLPEALNLAALLHLALNQSDNALATSGELIELLETPGYRIFERQAYLFTRAQALRAAQQDEEADEYLRRAHEWVLLVAGNTRDETLRHSWLENVRVNREILSVWAQRERRT